MPTTRRLAALVLAALLALAAAPAGTLAQSAGDEQYADPFAGQGSGSGSGSGSSGSGSGSSGSSGSSGTSGSSGSSSPSSGVAGSSSSEDPATTSPSSSATATASADELPQTGLDVRLVAGAGVVLLLAGLALRRRAADGRS